MKVLAFLRSAAEELVSLLVEDWVTFAGGLLALLVMYLLGHDVHALRSAGGFVAFGLVWVALAVSFARAARASRVVEDSVEEPEAGLRPFAHGEVERS